MFMLAIGLIGCWQEDLPQIDIHGKLVLPAEAVTREVPVFDEEGTAIGSESLTDPRLLGPIYIGAFSSIDTISFAYPHPSMGPIITADEPGNTYPYGGTTVGRLDFACYQALACKVTTGRFSNYSDVLDYFKNVLGTPVVDEHGNEVMSSDVFQQECYDYFHITSDQELSFIGADQFVDQGDGTWAADFTMAHTLLVEGMTLWGFMDAPKIEPYIDGGAYSAAANGGFTTCLDDFGNQHSEYDSNFYEGAPAYDILNFPSQYITEADYVADGTTTISSADETPTITLSVKVEE